MQQSRRRRAASVPVLRRPPRPDRAHLPSRQRVQALSTEVGTMNLAAASTQEEVALVLDVLTFGDFEIEGRLVDASNVALRGRLELDDIQTRVIYKPVDGERSLWDFPDGTLAEREAAAFVLSAVGGWNLVPPTVLREGPLGRGSVQLWVVAVAHADRPELASAAVFDVVINNADRKGSHLVLDESGSLWGFDHGVSCHTEPKLRTVLWGWVGQPLPEADLARLEALSGLSLIHISEP